MTTPKKLFSIAADSDGHPKRLSAHDIPEELPILPLRNTVAFPFTIIPLSIGISRSIQLVEDAQKGGQLIGLVAMKDPKIEEPAPGQVYEVGTIARIERVVPTAENQLNVIVHCLERFRVQFWTADQPYLKARVAPVAEILEEDLETNALHRSLLDLAREVVTLSPDYPKEAADFLAQIKNPRYLAYVVANYANIDIPKAQEVLQVDNVKDKLRLLISHLSREREVLSLGQKIQSDAREEIDKAQKDYFLRQQLKAIQKELGESDEGRPEIDDYVEKIQKAELSEEARKEAERELKRLQGMSPHAPEASMIRTYLDWLADLPWQKTSTDCTDIEHARTVLDAILNHHHFASHL